MPVKIRHVDGYRVSTPGGVKAKRTTKEKAEKQSRLLRGVEHGMVPRGQSKPRTTRQASGVDRERKAGPKPHRTRKSSRRK